jgi:E3 ubiquitin-protein ligase MYCBP2
LHRSHVFSTISRILSRSEELDNAAANTTTTANNASSTCESEGSVEKFVDVTANLELKVSSRQAMIGSLNDNSTETFWESGDEDRNKAKWLTATLLPQFRSSGKGNIFFITVGDA